MTAPNSGRNPVHLAVVHPWDFIRRTLLICLACLLAAAALATTPDEFRAGVQAGDIAGVKAALIAAEAEDAASTGALDAERALFSLCTESHDKVADFTLHWLAAEPGFPLAMTALGWQRYTAGRNIRGDGLARNVYRDVMRALHEDDVQAFARACKAIARDRKLIATADLVMCLTTSLGNPGIIPLELERVMTLPPSGAA